MRAKLGGTDKHTAGTYDRPVVAGRSLSVMTLTQQKSTSTAKDLQDETYPRGSR
jgi:hypothetical protein